MLWENCLGGEEYIHCKQEQDRDIFLNAIIKHCSLIISDASQPHMNYFTNEQVRFRREHAWN